MSLRQTLLKYRFWGPRFIGKDLQGNCYFEGQLGSTGRPKRSVEATVSHDQYTNEAIPVQWQAWLKHTRQDTPTVAELQQDEARRLKIHERLQHDLPPAKVPLPGIPNFKLDVKKEFQPQQWKPTPRIR